MGYLNNQLPDVPLILIVLACWLAILPFIAACISCGVMASRLGRSVIWWVFLSILSLNPLVCLACLYGMGESKEHRHKRILEEEGWKDKASISKYLSKD